MSSFHVRDSPSISALALVGATSSKLLFERMDLLEIQCLCNPDRSLIREQSQPLEVVLAKRNAAERSENSEDLPACHLPPIAGTCRW